jgi:hypothetical protein
MEIRIMAISLAGLSGGGDATAFANFVIELGDYNENTILLTKTYPLGGYTVSITPNDSSIDYYLVSPSGELAGYSNNSVLTATANFNTIVILGGQPGLELSFIYGGEFGTPSVAGQSVTAGAYITSTNPLSLPFADDTTIVQGGNFAAEVGMAFVNGGTTLQAKSVTRNSSTELVVTRPDNLGAALVEDWILHVSNPGIPVPSGSNVNQIQVAGGAVELYTTSQTITFSGPREYILVGGGGGGGQGFGGGGGGGGSGYIVINSVPAGTYTLVVGAGGAAMAAGGSSTFNSMTAAGGSQGQTYAQGQLGGAGGSGGGGGSGNNSNGTGGANGSDGTYPSGNPGAAGSGVAFPYYAEPGNGGGAGGYAGGNGGGGGGGGIYGGGGGGNSGAGAGGGGGGGGGLTSGNGGGQGNGGSAGGAGGAGGLIILEGS